MQAKRLLFISGSVGLGHVTRDLAMARALRQSIPGLAIDWLAASPASDVLHHEAETLLPEAAAWADTSALGAALAGQAAARGRPFHFNVLRSFLASRKEHRNNVEVFRRATAAQAYDLIIGDETYEIALALRAGRAKVAAPFVMLYDFIGADPATRNPLDWLGCYLINRRWALGYRQTPALALVSCFIGELEDVPDRPFGPGLPNRQRWTAERCRVLGHVLTFDLAACQDRTALRRKLGYGPEPLIVCTAGGSGAGGELLGLCLAGFPLLRQQLRKLQMVIVSGPRVDLPQVPQAEGLTILGYVPALYEHFAASDLVVTQAGGTSTLELSALRRPFLYFPLEGHFEQQVHVSGRLARYGAGVRMRFSETSAADLVETIMAHLGEDLSYPPIPAEGARRLAELAAELMGVPLPASAQPDDTPC